MLCHKTDALTQNATRAHCGLRCAVLQKLWWEHCRQVCNGKVCGCALSAPYTLAYSIPTAAR